MPEKKKPRFSLGTVDDLFTTQEMRDEAKLTKLHDIPVDEIDEFPDHPYQVRDDEDMLNLMESIRDNGILTPAIIRHKDDGRYEMISGHRRLHASKRLGLETIRCEIVDLDRDEATIVMCDSNLQRTTILPSEKAFAYKMRLDAMKRQGKRNDLTCTTPLHKLQKSSEILGNEVGESRETVRKYIRLTELIPEILELVDGGNIKLRPAVEISYLPEDLQYDLLDTMEMEACTPSHDQTIRMRRMLIDDKLTPEVITAIMQEEKPNQKERIIISDEKARKYLPGGLRPSEREAYILKALEFYGKHRSRQRDQER